MRFLAIALAIGSSAGAGCAQAGPEPNQDTVNLGFTPACIASIATQALANPRTNTIAANFAGPLGLTPTSDADAPPYQAKQVEFHFSDGTGHYFSVDTPQWTKALLIRVAPTAGEPRFSFFVMDRNGSLLAAGRVEDRRLSVLNIQEASVRADFYTEQAMWRLAGADHVCGRG